MELLTGATNDLPHGYKFVLMESVSHCITHGRSMSPVTMKQATLKNGDSGIPDIPALKEAQPARRPKEKVPNFVGR